MFTPEDKPEDPRKYVDSDHVQEDRRGPGGWLCILVPRGAVFEKLLRIIRNHAVQLSPYAPIHVRLFVDGPRVDWSIPLLCFSYKSAAERGEE